MGMYELDKGTGLLRLLLKPAGWEPARSRLWASTPETLWLRRKCPGRGTWQRAVMGMGMEVGPGAVIGSVVKRRPPG